MLEISHLSKSFDSLKAVDDISFDIKKGEIFGLLGPNGAGKTTVISMVASLLRQDSGKIIIDSLDPDKDLRKIKKVMGVVPQEMAFYEELTARENLVFWGKLQGLRKQTLEERITYYLEKTGLLGRENELLKKYSGGMKRRINLIIGLIHQPKLLLLDEPTIGIDVQTRLNIYQIIKEAASSGTTILYTTHNLQEEEGRKLMDRGKASALLIIPQKFGDNIWNGKPVELALLKNPSEQFLPQIVEEVCDIPSPLCNRFQPCLSRTLREN